jgi:hypothetical protein
MRLSPIGKTLGQGGCRGAGAELVEFGDELR